MLERSSALVRKATWLTPVWFVFLVGAAVAFATHARAIALVLVIVGGLGLITVFCLVVAASSISRGEQAAMVRDALADQQRRTGGSAPPPGAGGAPDTRD
jgi:hypothetical protein